MTREGPSESILKLIHDFNFDLNTRELEKVMLWFQEDAKVWIPPAPAIQGIKKINILLKVIFRRYSAIKWVINELYQTSENIVIVELWSSGTFTSGRIYENNLISVVKFNKGGKIFSISDYFKNTSIFM